MSINPYLFVYLLSVIIYYFLLRKGTLADTNYAVDTPEGAAIALIMMLIPVVNVIFIFIFLNSLYFNWSLKNIKSKFKLKKPIYKYILFID